MSVSAGWYPDPVAPGHLRYWSGLAWTQQTEPIPLPAPTTTPVIALTQAATRPAPVDGRRQADDVWLPAAMIEWGDLPSVCVKHGRRAVQMPTVKVYSKTPIWVVLLLIGSLLIGAIVALAMRVTVTGRWPVCPECAATRSRRLTGMWICLAAIPISIALAVWTNWAALLLIFPVAALAGLILGSMSSWTALTQAAVDRSTHAIHIKRPARGFVAALPVQARR